MMCNRSAATNGRQCLVRSHREDQSLDRRSATIVVARQAEQLEDLLMQWRQSRHKCLLAASGCKCVPLDRLEDVEYASGRGTLAGSPFRVQRQRLFVGRLQ